ncbi:MAG: phage major capsid protein [Clostridia bacterium]|nr:phage major capsid protein [Clostridia bacterium]
MKKFLKKLIERKKKEKEKLEERMKNSQDVEEVRSLGETLLALRDEITEAEEQLAELEENDDNSNNNDNEGEDEGDNNRSATNNNGANEGRSTNGFNPNAVLNVIGTAQMNNGQARSTEDPRATMEYRTAFQNYIQRGEINRDILQFEQRADVVGTSGDLGVLLPTTVIQKVITEVEKKYGQLYSRVRKTNLQGGVKYPIGSFDASFCRITETKTSDRQKAGNIKGYVEFSYNIGEIKLARTLLQTILSVEVFEEEFAKVIAKAYIRAMDKEIMTGKSEDGQCEGILTEAAKAESRIPTNNIISFTADEVADWTKWQEKLFAKIPLAMRGLNPEFVMTANTYESNIKTLKDNNNRPLYNETFNPVDGAEICKFKGKDVALVEEDIVKNFNDAADGEVFGMYWVPEEGYAINSNLEFVVMDYFDHDLNQYIKKALVVNDGKILDPKYIYLLKKAVKA